MPYLMVLGTLSAQLYVYKRYKKSKNIEERLPAFGFLKQSNRVKDVFCL